MDEEVVKMAHFAISIKNRNLTSLTLNDKEKTFAECLEDQIMQLCLGWFARSGFVLTACSTGSKHYGQITADESVQAASYK